MTDDAFYRSIESLCRVPEGTIDSSTRLKELGGWDSMAVVEFIALLDSDYGKTAEFDQISACQTAGDLAMLTH